MPQSFEVALAQREFNQNLMNFLQYTLSLFPDATQIKSDMEDLKTAMLLDIPEPSKQFIERMYPYEDALKMRNAEAMNFSHINQERMKAFQDEEAKEKLWDDLNDLYNVAKTAQPNVYLLKTLD